MVGLPYTTGATVPPDSALTWYAPPVPYQLAIAREGLTEVWGANVVRVRAFCSPSVNELLRLRLRQAGWTVEDASGAPADLPAGVVGICGDHEPPPVGTATFPIYPATTNELAPFFLVYARGSAWHPPPWGLVTRAEASALLVAARRFMARSSASSYPFNR